MLSAVLARHTRSAAEKFVQEVFWRTYWKGWLQAHPAAWTRYRETLAEEIAQLETSSSIRQKYTDATSGRSGIDAFDAWVGELIETNYLHNHARMWFASIWIFTLGLPWELGADFFMRNLLDGDPASNTLSWRWVAGLHTRGKVYAATNENIRRYTGEQFCLNAPLVRGPRALDDAPLPIKALAELPLLKTEREPTLFVIHEDDVHGDLQELPATVRAVAAIGTTVFRSPQAMHPAVLAFSSTVLSEGTAAIARTTGAADYGVIAAADPQSAAAFLMRAAAECGATRIVAAFAPIGPARDWLDIVAAGVTQHGVAYRESARRYDAAAWPAATRGFFGLRSRIPAILSELAIAGGAA